MSRLTGTLNSAPFLLLFALCSAGCATLPTAGPVPEAAPPPQIAPAAEADEVSPPPAAVAARPFFPAEAASPACPDLPFAGRAALSVDDLVEQVLARNPSLAEMVAAWRAAQARYPQATALEDPMLAATLGPRTFAPDDPDVHFAYRVEVSQKLPWCGKRALRGESALAEAGAAGNDVDDMRLQLIESARTAFSDYYLADRALAVNRENLKLFDEFRRNAAARYETGKAGEQDVLQADVEIGRQRERRLTLERMHLVAVARINTLLHLPPDAPLPPPPAELTVGDDLPEPPVLRRLALERRPDLQALANRIAADEAQVGLAYKDFYPDLEPFFMYDRFMGNNETNDDLAPQLGVRLNLPVYRAKRHAAVAEAQARVNRRRAELARKTDEVNFQVQQAYTQVRESQGVVRLYRETILRAAEQNRKSAASAYVTGKVPFLNVVEAERDEVGLKDRYYEAVADYFRRRAALERAAGGPLLTPLVERNSFRSVGAKRTE